MRDPSRVTKQRKNFKFAIKGNVCIHHDFFKLIVSSTSRNSLASNRRARTAFSHSR
jgi:hypothetical protein